MARNVAAACRVFAALIAAAAWIGLAIQFAQTYSEKSSLLTTLWILFAYFTILTNLLVAVLFTLIALDRVPHGYRSGSILAGTMLSTVLVGILVAIFLQGALELSGGSPLVDKLLHVVTPILVPLFWIFCARKGNLDYWQPLLWAIFPFSYLMYGIIRGSMTGRHAYPFLDLGALGWQRTSFNALSIALAFMACGYVVVWIDHLIAARQRVI